MDQRTNFMWSSPVICLCLFAHQRGHASARPSGCRCLHQKNKWIRYFKRNHDFTISWAIPFQVQSRKWPWLSYRASAHQSRSALPDWRQWTISGACSTKFRKVQYRSRANILVKIVLMIAIGEWPDGTALSRCSVHNGESKMEKRRNWAVAKKIGFRMSYEDKIGN